MIENYAVIDLFCGVGGLTHGFVLEGFDVAAGIDFDLSCKYAYEKNNKTTFLHKDISKLTSEELAALFPEGKRKILVGCAPCQPYSIFNRNQSKPATITEGQADEDDPRWLLLYSFSKLIIEIKPEIVSMENVPLLKNFKGGKVFNDFIALLKENGYHITCQTHNAQDYGVPQRRKRLVLLASLKSKIEMIAPTHLKEKAITVKEAIGKLPSIKDGETDKKDPLHRARKLTDLSIKRIQATKEGGSWIDWDENLKLECHKNEGGKLYKSVYGRMSWNEVAPTMTTYCVGLNNGRFGHPEQDRAISLREAALLQSFPIDYDFIDPKNPLTLTNLAKHIGNAVPVGLGLAVAKSIKQYIEQNP
jgi:DNA (cytosine-5)-methyltransferase 1